MLTERTCVAVITAFELGGHNEAIHSCHTDWSEASMAAEAANVEAAGYDAPLRFFVQEAVVYEFVDDWLGVGMVVHQRLQTDGWSFEGAVVVDSRPRASAKGNNLAELALRLSLSVLSRHEVLSPNSHRPERTELLLPFLLAVAEVFGVVVSSQLSAALTRWSEQSSKLYAEYLWFCRAWSRLKPGDLGATRRHMPGVAVSTAHLLVSDEYYSHEVLLSFWFTEQQAQAELIRRGQLSDGDVCRVVFAEAYTHPSSPGYALTLHLAANGNEEDLVCVALHDLAVLLSDEIDDVWRGFQYNHSVRRATRHEALVEAVLSLMDACMVQFPRFPPGMVYLPLAVLMEDGSVLPWSLRRRLTAWVQSFDAMVNQWSWTCDQVERAIAALVEA